jgi:hypothetical protein
MNSQASGGKVSHPPTTPRAAKGMPPATAQDGSQGIGHPGRQSAGAKGPGGIGRAGFRRPRAANQSQDRARKQQKGQSKKRRTRASNDQRMGRQRRRFIALPAAQGARNGGDHTAPHGAG